jgi:small subunit ribosomal protein S24e
LEIKILEERANPLLKRHEYRFEIAHATAATPTRDSVRGELSKLFKAPKDRVIVERMRARFGTAVTRGDALVYESAEAAKATEREHILVRNGLKEKVAKGAATTAAEPTKAGTAPEGSPKVEAPAPAEKKE